MVTSVQTTDLFTPERPVSRDLTFISGRGGDSGGFTGTKAGEPVTAAQDCVSTFVSVTSLDVCGVFGDNLQLSWERSQDVATCLRRDKNGWLQPNLWGIFNPV